MAYTPIAEDVVYKLPARWVSYLFYADHSDLNDEEIEKVDAWVERNNYPELYDVSDEYDGTYEGIYTTLCDYKCCGYFA